MFTGRLSRSWKLAAGVALSLSLSLSVCLSACHSLSLSLSQPAEFCSSSDISTFLTFKDRGDQRLCTRLNRPDQIGGRTGYACKSGESLHSLVVTVPASLSDTHACTHTHTYMALIKLGTLLVQIHFRLPHTYFAQCRKFQCSYW